jgi:hypothetical protein
MMHSFQRVLLGLEIPELDEDAFQPRGRQSGMRLYGGKGGGGSAPAPDPMIGKAAVMNVELGQQWLDFAKDQFAEGNKRQATTDELNTKVINQQLQSQDEASTWAKQDRARTLNTFQPVEDTFVKTAQEYDTPEKQEAAAAAAKADVFASAGVQQQANARQMASMGVNPDSGRFAGITRYQDTNTALAAAGAQNNARQIVRDKGLALKADAINMGKGLASSTAAAYGIGTNAGNSAVANNASGNQNFYQNQGVMAQGFNGAVGANNSAGSMLNNLYGNQLNAWSAQQQANATSAAGVGQMIGTIGGAALPFMLSDERAKENIERIGTLPSGISIFSFEYKPEFRDIWGHGEQIGVLAQDVEKFIPEAVRMHESGYKMVDYQKVVNHGV